MLKGCDIVNKMVLGNVSWCVEGGHGARVAGYVERVCCGMDRVVRVDTLTRSLDAPRYTKCKPTDNQT